MLELTDKVDLKSRAKKRDECMTINRFHNHSKIYNLSDVEFETLIKESKNYSDCLRKLDLSVRGSASRSVLKKRINELNLDISHFNSRYKYYTEENRNKNFYSNEEIFCKDSIVYSTSSLKNRIFKDNLIEYKCAICGNIGEWNGQNLYYN